MSKISKGDIESVIKKLVHEYTGTGASGGNATDGNDITSPRPFADDMEEMENYIFKNIYGGEGGQYRGMDSAFGPSYNRHPQGLYEEEKELRSFIQKEIRKYYGVHDTYGVSSGQRRNLSGLPGVWEELQEQADPGVIAALNTKKVNLQKALANVDIDITKANMKAIGKQTQAQRQQITQQINQIDQQIAAAVTDKKKAKLSQARIDKEIEELNKDEELPDDIKRKRREELNQEKQKRDEEFKNQEDLLKKLTGTKNQTFAQSANIDKQAEMQKRQYQKQIRQQTLAMKKIGTTTVREYFKNTNVNLMDRMDSYRREAKRAILMEGAMMKFFEMFEKGQTDEEIIQGYANKGVQVPETFVSSARKQYEGYKKLKLELEMSEKEFKNSAKEIVNNPDGEVTIDIDEKQLASGLFKEEKEKEEKGKEKKGKEVKGKINIDTDEVEVLDDVEDVDGITINIKEREFKNLIKK